MHPLSAVRPLCDCQDVAAYAVARAALVAALDPILAAGHGLNTWRASELFDELVARLEDAIGAITAAAEAAAEEEDHPDTSKDEPYRNASGIFG